MDLNGVTMGFMLDTFQVLPVPLTVAPNQEFSKMGICFAQSFRTLRTYKSRHADLARRLNLQETS